MPARGKPSKKKDARKKAVTNKSAAGKSPKKKDGGTQTVKAKSAETKSGGAAPSKKKSAPAGSPSSAKRPFSLTASQAEAVKKGLSDCKWDWGIEVRTSDKWKEAKGKGLPDHDDWLFKSKEGLIAADGEEKVIEGFELGVVFGWEISQLPPLGTLASLGVTRLSAAGSFSKKGKISDISSIDTLKGLKSLSFSNCNSLSDIKALSKLNQLETLDLSDCKALTDISGPAQLKKLQALDLSGCEKLTKLSDIAGMKSLQSLDLSKCARLSDLAGLSKLKRLQHLNLSNCGALAKISELSGLKELESLDLSECIEITSVSDLSRLAGLQSLDLSGCQKLEGISELAGLKGLQRLNLSILLGRPSKLTDVSTVAKLKGLRELDLSYFKSLEDLSGLAGLKNLRSLKLTGCSALTDTSALARLTKLETLTLSGCTALTKLSDLAGLTNLKSLDLSGCTALLDVSDLAGLADLQTLNLTKCSNIGNLDDLSNCTSLRTLKWIETPACDAILAACAARREDVPYVVEKAASWVGSLRESKDPDFLARNLVKCFALATQENWAETLADFVELSRNRGGLVRSETWAHWSKAVLAQGDPALRDPIEKALDQIDPANEIKNVLAPVLTALADAVPNFSPDTEVWANELVKTTLARHAKNPDEAREAAAAATVFYKASDQDEKVREWLKHGTHPRSPRWRDRIRVALVEWQLRRTDQDDLWKLEQALDELKRIQTSEQKDRAHKALARKFDLFETGSKAAVEHLEEIEDEVSKVALASELAEAPEITGTVEGLYGLLLPLQEDPKKLAGLIEKLVKTHGDSAVVADISQAFKDPREVSTTEQVMARLGKINIENLSPMAAFDLVKELKDLSGEDEA